jgi:putative ATP-binding cassette transporter
MKAFFDFVRAESAEFRTPLIAMAIFAGIVNGLAVSVAIQTVYMIQPGEVNTTQMFKLGACLVCFWISKEYVLNRTVSIVETIVENTRNRILKKIRNSELLRFEQMDCGRVLSILSTDAAAISTSAGAAINAGSGLVMLAFIVVLIGVVSPIALLITGGMILLAVVLYLKKSRHVAEHLTAAALNENVFYENLNGVLHGFKELKLNRLKADDFYDHEVEQVVKAITQRRILAGKAINQSVLIGQTFLIFAIGGLLFLLPVLQPGELGIIGILVPVILFAAGPIGEIVGTIPMIAKAQASVYNIQQLETQIDAGNAAAECRGDTDAWEPTQFKQISLKEISFQYPAQGSRPFLLPPFDFACQPGEIVFIVGGNGSGKSTFLKLLTGLYTPQSGTMTLNGQSVDSTNITSYRNLFSTIFSDFHLFRRILGVEDFTMHPIREMLERFELWGKTDIVNGEISNLQLSTGQKKRLALIVATLDDKPIYVFDEWAADQDPVFRRYFYEVILQDLKRAGKTVIAVTHDDHYFDRADRVYAMDYGRLVPYSKDTLGSKTGQAN